jgi:NAD(P)-dependent dehydrogenase (short-subunit alcohol dehydrogenase family)
MTTILDKFNLTDRVAVVTGGVGLLGTEFCRTLAEAGAAVAVVDLSAEKCAAVADLLVRTGYRALAAPTDITQPNGVKALVEKVMSTFGRLDILVNSAALDPSLIRRLPRGESPPAVEYVRAAGAGDVIYSN